MSKKTRRRAAERRRYRKFPTVGRRLRKVDRKINEQFAQATMPSAFMDQMAIEYGEAHRPVPGAQS